MSSQPVIFEVSTAEFEEHVLKASSAVPVVVDFWAEWCAPCLSLGPVLEKLVNGSGGRLRLAKVNVETDPELAGRYGVQGIPAVKVFRDGKVAAEFVGALAEPEVARILESVVPSAVDELLLEGDRRLEAGAEEEAESIYRRALEADEAHTGALLRLGTLLLERGSFAEARQVLDRIEENAAEFAVAQGLLGRIEFQEVCRAAGGRAACEGRVSAGPEDLEAHYALGCCLASAGEYEPALEHFLQVLTLDRNFRDGAARAAMLHIFTLADPHSDLANTYRKKMAGALY